MSGDTGLVPYLKNVPEGMLTISTKGSDQLTKGNCSWRPGVAPSFFQDSRKFEAGFQLGGTIQNSFQTPKYCFLAPDFDWTEDRSYPELNFPQEVLPILFIFYFFSFNYLFHPDHEP